MLIMETKSSATKATADKTTPKPAATKAAAAPSTETTVLAPASTPTTPGEPILANVTITPAPAAPEPTAKGKMLKVKVLRSHPNFGYFAGDEAEISEDDFKAYGKGAEGGEFFAKA
jgi:hypothetical protein